jgi:hypothetical protein
MFAAMAASLGSGNVSGRYRSDGQPDPPTTREATTLPSTLNVQLLGEEGDNDAALIVTTAELRSMCDADRLGMCFTWTMS